MSCLISGAQPHCPTLDVDPPPPPPHTHTLAQFLHTFVRGKGLIVTHADMHTKRMAEVQQQGVTAFIIRRIRQVLWMKSQHGASMTAQLLALHNTLTCCMAQHKALVMEDHCIIAAPQRVWCSCTPRPCLRTSVVGHTPVATGTAQTARVCCANRGSSTWF